MDFIDKLEKKYGKYAIKNIIRNIMMIQVVLYIIYIFIPNAYNFEVLYLIPQKVLKGELWRLLSFIFIPPIGSNIFFGALTIYMHYMIGTVLEKTWGEFKFNLYYLIGLLAAITVSFIFGGIGTTVWLNSTMFLAFATIYPDYEFLMMFIIPVKVKYLAFLTWILYAITIITGDWSLKLLIITALLNYALFFYKEIFVSIRYRRRKIINNKKKEKEEGKALHKCTVCSVTELENPEIGFRYCSKCRGHYEYCMDHIKDHEHIEEKEI